MSEQPTTYPAPWCALPLTIGCQGIYDATGKFVATVRTEEAARQIVLSVNRYAQAYPNSTKEKA